MTGDLASRRPNRSAVAVSIERWTYSPPIGFTLTKSRSRPERRDGRPLVRDRRSAGLAFDPGIRCGFPSSHRRDTNRRRKETGGSPGNRMRGRGLTASLVEEIAAASETFIDRHRRVFRVLPRPRAAEARRRFRRLSRAEECAIQSMTDAARHRQNGEGDPARQTQRRRPARRRDHRAPRNKPRRDRIALPLSAKEPS